MKLKHLYGLAALLLLSACGGSEEAEKAATEELDNSSEVQAYYDSKPDFFRVRTPADLPTDLTWENGSHLPEMGSSEAKKGGTIYGRIQDFPRTLRIVGPDSNGSFRRFLLDDISVNIAHRHYNEFDFYPGLAESWAVDREKRTIYVKLDPTAQWSDSEPVTTDDFMFMFFFYQSAYIVAPWYNNWYSNQYLNITKYDELTFSITIPSAKPDMDARVLQLRPVPQHFYNALGDDFVERYQWQFAPTTGAYVIRDEDIRKGRSIALVRQQDWWAKDKKNFRYRYNPDRIHISVIRDTPKVFEAFKLGDIDQFSLDLAEYWYEKLPHDDPDVAGGYIHKSVFYNDRPRPTYGLWINTSRPKLDNQDIRIGINYASNWDLIIEKFFRGDYKRMLTSSDGYGEFSHPTLAARPFDIERAQEAFARAGFVQRGPDGILVNDAGERLSFTLSSGYENLKDILTILKEEAAKAGLEFRIELLDGTSGWKKVQEKKHDIHFSAFGVALEMYPRFWETYHSDNAYDNGAFIAGGTVNPDRKLKTQTNNLEMMAIKEMDELIKQYRASNDRQEMIELANTMTKMHHDYASFVPGFVQPGYRLGHWRWVKYPEGFNYKYSESAGQLFVHWIDPELKKETIQARKDGVTFPAQINTYDQFETR